MKSSDSDRLTPHTVEHGSADQGYVCTNANWERTSDEAKRDAKSKCDKLVGGKG